MIQVDISNVWGAFSLPDFLGMERVIAEAHSRLAQNTETNVQLSEDEWKKLQTIAGSIRKNFEICVVVGSDAQTLAARGVTALLQGAHRNLRNKPIMLFTGHSFSSAHFQELIKVLEGKKYCVLAVSGGEPETEPFLALRSLRWMLERKYGWEGARKRIFAVTASQEEPLYHMAQQGQWESLVCGGSVGGLSGGTLEILAAAGIDIKAIAAGVNRAMDALDLRSFENPAWLYAAARTLLGQKGKTVEVLQTAEPDFDLLGRWWQEQFSGQTAVIYARFPSQMRSMEAFLQNGTGFVTRLQLAKPENPTRIVPDLENGDGLNCLTDITLETVAERAMDAMVQTYQDWGVSVIGIDSDAAGEEALGELLFFMELSRNFCMEIPSENRVNLENKPSLSATILQIFADDNPALPNEQ